MTRITSIFAAAFIASASFAGAAFAEGDYYEGANDHQKSTEVDNMTTSSIAEFRSEAPGNGQPVFEKTSRDNR